MDASILGILMCLGIALSLAAALAVGSDIEYSSEDSAHQVNLNRSTTLAFLCPRLSCILVHGSSKQKIGRHGQI